MGPGVRRQEVGGHGVDKGNETMARYEFVSLSTSTSSAFDRGSKARKARANDRGGRTEHPTRVI
jgi:hypothetical protein